MSTSQLVAPPSEATKKSVRSSRNIDQLVRDKYPAPPGREIFRIGKVNEQHVRITYHVPNSWDMGPSSWISQSWISVSTQYGDP